MHRTFKNSITFTKQRSVINSFSFPCVLTINFSFYLSIKQSKLLTYFYQNRQDAYFGIIAVQHLEKPLQLIQKQKLFHCYDVSGSLKLQSDLLQGQIHGTAASLSINKNSIAFHLLHFQLLFFHQQFEIRLLIVDCIVSTWLVP